MKTPKISLSLILIFSSYYSFCQSFDMDDLKYFDNGVDVTSSVQSSSGYHFGDCTYHYNDSMLEITNDNNPNGVYRLILDDNFDIDFSTGVHSDLPYPHQNPYGDEIFDEVNYEPNGLNLQTFNRIDTFFTQYKDEVPCGSVTWYYHVIPQYFIMDDFKYFDNGVDVTSNVQSSSGYHFGDCTFKYHDGYLEITEDNASVSYALILSDEFLPSFWTGVYLNCDYGDIIFDIVNDYPNGLNLLNFDQIDDFFTQYKNEDPMESTRWDRMVTDLEIDNPITLSSSPYIPGESISVSATISNIGYEASSQSTLKLYIYSSDNGTTLLNSQTVQSIAVGNSTTEQISGTLPSGYGGNCSISLKIETAPIDNEEYLFKNSRSASIYIEKPDLQITSISTSSNTIDQGATVDVTVTAKNFGLATAGASEIGIYLSDSSTGLDELLGTVSLESLAAGESKQKTKTVTIPTDANPGNSYIVCKVDNSEIIEEDDELNNTLSNSINVDQIFFPDILVTDIVFKNYNTNTIPYNQSFHFLITLSNQGDAVANLKNIYVFIKKFTTNSYTQITFDDFNEQIPINGTITKEIFGSIGTDWRGSCYLYGVANHGDNSDEQNTDNNTIVKNVFISTNKSITTFKSCNLSDEELKLSENSQDISCKLFPNPSKGNFNIQWGSKPFLNLTVFDKTGRQVYYENIENISTTNVELLNVQPGLYFVELSNESEKEIKKLIIK